MAGTLQRNMKKFVGLLIICSFFVSDMAIAYDGPSPTFCRDYRKKKPFSLRFPNLSVCLNAAQPHDQVIGSIEWCRKSYTKMDVDEYGRTIQYRATDITYRYVLCNGGYGTCYSRTQRDGPIEYPTVSAKGGKVGIFK